MAKTGTAQAKIQSQEMKQEPVFRELEENVGSGIFILQGKKFRYVNSAFIKLCGF